MKFDDRITEIMEIYLTDFVLQRSFHYVPESTVFQSESIIFKLTSSEKESNRKTWLKIYRHFLSHSIVNLIFKSLTSKWTVYRFNILISMLLIGFYACSMLPTAGILIVLVSSLTFVTNRGAVFIRKSGYSGYVSDSDIEKVPFPSGYGVDDFTDNDSAEESDLPDSPDANNLYDWGAVLPASTSTLLTQVSLSIFLIG